MNLLALQDERKCTSSLNPGSITDVYAAYRELDFGLCKVNTLVYRLPQSVSIILLRERMMTGDYP